MMRDPVHPQAHSEPASGTTFARPMSRRQLLRTFAISGGVLVGGAVLASCGGANSSQQTVDVTISSASWPYSAMPDQATQAKDPTQKAYAEALKQWNAKNPGVKIKNVSLNIWDSQALSSAIQSGTAPAWYPTGVIGSWNLAGMRAAFAQNLAADVTALHQQYGTEQKIASYAKTSWHQQLTNGKYYDAPVFFDTGGSSFFYRRDLFQAAGLPEPTQDMTWSDVRTWAKALTTDKRKGLATQSYGLGFMLNDTFFDIYRLLPAPKSPWHWHIDYNNKMDTWVKVTDIYRGMRFVDKSMLTDVTYTDGEVNKAFGRGDVAMSTSPAGLFTDPVTQPGSPGYLARQLNKNIDEVVGLLKHPHGFDGAFSASGGGSVWCLSFDPHLSRNPSALDKAFGLHFYMTFGQGAIDQKVSLYNSTKDLQQVFNSNDVMPLNGITTYSGIPGTPEDAWGKRYVQAINAFINLPPVPDSGSYLPAEKNTGPSDTPWNDALTALSTTQKSATSILSNTQSIYTQQESGFTSSISETDFTNGIRKYYADLNKYVQQVTPAYYTSTFQPWYQKYIVPVIGS